MLEVAGDLRRAPAKFEYPDYCICNNDILCQLFALKSKNIFLRRLERVFSYTAWAIYTKMHASAEWIKISSPEVKCCVKSREPEIKSAENISC